jgi:hypothetical protein
MPQSKNKNSPETETESEIDNVLIPFENAKENRSSVI